MYDLLNRFVIMRCYVLWGYRAAFIPSMNHHTNVGARAVVPVVGPKGIRPSTKTAMATNNHMQPTITKPKVYSFLFCCGPQQCL